MSSASEKGSPPPGSPADDDVSRKSQSPCDDAQTRTTRSSPSDSEGSRNKRLRTERDLPHESNGDRNINDSDEGPGYRYRDRKRLSINTSLAPLAGGRPGAKTATGLEMMEQMESIRSQQQAISGSRNTSSAAPVGSEYDKERFDTKFNKQAWQSSYNDSRGPSTAPIDGQSSQNQSLLHPNHSTGRSHGNLNTKASKLQPSRTDNNRFHSRSDISSEMRSPRLSEFPSRQLPLPAGHGSHGSFDRHSGTSPLPPLANLGASSSKTHLPSMPHQTSPPPQSAYINTSINLQSRSAFIAPFEAIYDQLEESARLQKTLKDQIRKSTAMLQALQASGQMIEGLVRSHFREMQLQYGEKFGAALTDVNRRLCALEEKAGMPSNASTSNNWGFRGGPPSAHPNGANAPPSTLADDRE